MMEEANDEQPEIVTHEEVALAEKEAAQSQSSSGGVPAPSPLPAFLTSTATSSTSSTPSTPSILPTRPTGSPAAIPASSLQSSGSAVKSPPVASMTPTRDSPARKEAPGPMQTPFEASSAIAVSGGAEGSSMQAPPSNQGGSLLGWLSSNSLVNRVVEKTKSSMESVITTLDPGMKEVIRSGGEVEVVVTSTKDNKLLAVREAFQQTFGRATVTGKEGEATTAAQPVGFTAGLKGAEDRINALQRSGQVTENATIVSIEGFIVELFPDKWYEMSCLLLRDPVHKLTLQTCSQPTLVPSHYVMAAQDKTPSDYPLRWSGLAVTIGQVIETDQPHIGRADWQKVMSGVSRRDSLYLASLSLAHMYKQQLPTSFIS